MVIAPRAAILGQAEMTMLGLGLCLVGLGLLLIAYLLYLRKVERESPPARHRKIRAARRSVRRRERRNRTDVAAD